jgi:alkanesulfonate monooxygenase SsuD/methylene tetrahydromethanopterin reductase-like flavin-dependent oxidoreductase (luciferase family)
MQFGINLGMPSPALAPAEQLDEWRHTLAVAERAGYSFVSVLHQWLSHPFQFLAPFPVLAWLAGQAPGLTYMTGVLQLPVLNPAQLAEDVVTADYLTNGRFMLGVGIGYRPELFQAAGADRADRVARFTEALSVMTALLSGAQVDHSGRFFEVHGRLARVPSAPVPVVAGGQSFGAVRRAGRLGLGWYVPSQVGEDDLAELVPAFLAARAEAGHGGDPVLVLTRNVCVADTDSAALAHAATFMGDTFGAYRTLGLEEKTTVRVHRSFEEEVSKRAIVGSTATCTDRLRALVDRYPVSHLQLRPQGPGFVGGEQGLRESLSLLGNDVLPKLR